MAQMIIIGVPYDIEVSTSVNLGEFTVEFSIDDKDVKYNIAMKKSGDMMYSMTIPSKLSFLGEKELNYSVLVHKDNAKFVADTGKILIGGENLVKSKEKEIFKVKHKEQKVADASSQVPESVTPDISVKSKPAAVEVKETIAEIADESTREELTKTLIDTIHETSKEIDKKDKSLEEKKQELDAKVREILNSLPQAPIPPKENKPNKPLRDILKGIQERRDDVRKK